MEKSLKEKFIITVARLVISFVVGVITAIFLDFFKIGYDYLRTEHFLAFIGIVSFSYFSLSVILEKYRLINKQNIIISVIATVLGIILSFKFKIIGDSFFISEGIRFFTGNRRYRDFIYCCVCSDKIHPTFEKLFKYK